MQTDFIKSSAPEAWDLQGTGSAAGAGGGSSSAGSAVNTQDTSQNFAGFTDIGSGFEGGNVLFRNSGYLRLGQGDNSVIFDANDALYRVAVGSETYAIAPFRVQKDGKFHAGSSSQYIDWDGTKLTIAGDVVQIDTSTGAVKGSLQNVISLTAGETISGATLPVAVFLQDSDNQVYACDADDTSRLDFLGFAITTATSGNAITVQTDGVVSGFTGLTYGAKYYVQNDKTIGVNPGRNNLLVGQAISTTSLIISKIPSSIVAGLNGFQCPVGIVSATGAFSSIINSGTGNNTSLFFDAAGANLRIYRYDISPTTGAVIVNNNGTNAYWLDAASYDTSCGIVCARDSSDYIYTWAKKTATGIWYLLRITIADSTITEMTISGTAPDADANNRLAFDSTGKLWVFDWTGTTVRSYTISGTTATYNSAVTLSAASESTNSYVYGIDNSDNFMYSSGPTFIKVDNSSGANVKTIKGVSASGQSARYGIPIQIFKSNGYFFGWKIQELTVSGTGIAVLSVFNGY